MVAFVFNYANYGFSMLDFIACLPIFVPVSASKTTRLLLSLGCVAAGMATIWLLDPKRVLDAVERSVRAQVFHGEHRLFAWVLNVGLLNMMQVYYMISL